VIGRTRNQDFVTRRDVSGIVAWPRGHRESDLALGVVRSALPAADVRFMNPAGIAADPEGTAGVLAGLHMSTADD